MLQSVEINDVAIPRRDMIERVQISVATLERRDVESQRRDVTEKAPNFFFTHIASLFCKKLSTCKLYSGNVML